MSKRYQMGRGNDRWQILDTQTDEFVCTVFGMKRGHEQGVGQKIVDALNLLDGLENPGAIVIEDPGALIAAGRRSERLHIAAMAMQGIIASNSGEMSYPKREDATGLAVEYADALIARINQ